MRLTGIVSTVCVPLPDWFKWILGTTGKLRCVPCCGIYPEVGQPVRRGSFSPLRMMPHLPSRLPTVFPTPVRTLLPSHMGTLLQTLFPTPLGTPLQTPISQLCSSLSPALSPKCPKFRTPLPSPLPPPLPSPSQPHFNAMIYHAQDGEHWCRERRYNGRDRKARC